MNNLLMFLTDYQLWRKGDESILQPHPERISAAINECIERFSGIQNALERFDLGRDNEDKTIENIKSYMK